MMFRHRLAAPNGSTRRRWTRLSLLALLLVAAVGLVPATALAQSTYGGGPSGSMDMMGSTGMAAGNDQSAPAAAGQMVIHIRNFSFGSPITVAAGTTVQWINDDSVAHTVTADAGAFDSGSMAPGATFQFTFNQAGDFPYYCRFHGGPGGQGMASQITVTGQGGQQGQQNQPSQPSQAPQSNPYGGSQGGSGYGMNAPSYGSSYGTQAPSYGGGYGTQAPSYGYNNCPSTTYSSPSYGMGSYGMGYPSYGSKSNGGYSYGNSYNKGSSSYGNGYSNKGSSSYGGSGYNYSGKGSMRYGNGYYSAPKTSPYGGTMRKPSYSGGYGSMKGGRSGYGY